VWKLLPIQYADQVLWQRRLLGDQDDPQSLYAQQLDYWREALAGMPKALELSVDRPLSGKAGYCSGTIPLEIPAFLHAKLRAVARQNKATLSMVLQAGLGMLLARLGAGSTIPIGVPVAGRDDVVLDDVIGCFANVLVLDVDIRGDPTFSELVARVREIALEAHAHRDVPFDRLAELISPEPERSLTRHPLVQVSIALQNAPEDALRFPGLSVTDVAVSTAASTFDLLIALQESIDAKQMPNGIRGELRYRTYLFDHARAELIGTSLIRLFQEVAADPGPVNVADPDKAGPATCS
jgi:pristinamycin I synthase-3/4